MNREVSRKLSKDQSIDNLGIPPLAGVATYEEAARPGYGVEQNVSLMRRYNYTKKRLIEIYSGHLASVPEWEVKGGLSLHMWLESEHCKWFRQRVGEMRKPPLHLDRVPDEMLEAAMDEVLHARTTVELVVGIYRVVKPALLASIERHIQETNPLADHPTLRIMKLMRMEDQEMIEWGQAAIDAVIGDDHEKRAEATAWEAHLRAFLDAAGGIRGEEPASEPVELPEARAAEPFQIDKIPARDHRFEDIYNISASFNDIYKDRERPVDERTWALMCKRLEEMVVPEWMAPIVYEAGSKPWDYYVDMTRQLWDEARHSMMGEIALVSRGVPFYAYPVAVTSSHAMNTEFSSLEVHAILYAIEQSLMPGETGKRYEAEIASASEDPLATLFQDYDWADEVLHAQTGRKWLVPALDMKGPELKSYLDSLYERFYEAKREISKRSSQENWWPEFWSEMKEHVLD